MVQRMSQYSGHLIATGFIQSLCCKDRSQPCGNFLAEAFEFPDRFAQKKGALDRVRSKLGQSAKGDRRKLQVVTHQKSGQRRGDGRRQNRFKIFAIREKFETSRSPMPKVGGFMRKC